jgi:mRNA interferase MazF
MRRGEVWWTDLGQPRASQPGFRRPTVIISSDGFNASKIGTLVVLPLTTTARRAADPGNVVVRRRPVGLPTDYVVNVSQPMAIDRAALLKRIGHLTAALMREVDDGLRLSLNL